MEHLYKIYDMLDRELEDVCAKGDMSTQTIDLIDEVSHAMKSIKAIIAMEEADHGYSGRGYYDDGMHRGDHDRSYGGRSYRRMR